MKLDNFVGTLLGTHSRLLSSRVYFSPNSRVALLHLGSYTTWRLTIPHFTAHLCQRVTGLCHLTWERDCHLDFMKESSFGGSVVLGKEWVIS